MFILSTIRNNKGILFFGAVLGLVIAFLSLMFFSDDFTVQTDYLIIQQSAETQDFYTLSKSVEYSGGILQEAVRSSLFFSEAANTNLFSPNAFPSSERERLKVWRKSVTVSQKPGSGILQVAVRRPSQSEAKGVAQAVSTVLIEKNELFRSGTKDTLSIKVISGPIVEQNPTLKMLIFSLVSGFTFGFFFMLMLLIPRRLDNMYHPIISGSSLTGSSQ